MYISVAGKDSTSRLSARLVEQAATRRPLQAESPEDSALRLRESKNADDYVDQFYRLLRVHSSVDDSPLFRSARQGWIGHVSERVKTLLWRILRYQHDHITFQQNMINELLINAMDFQQAAIRDDLAELKSRVESLQAEVAALREKDAGDLPS